MITKAPKGTKDTLPEEIYKWHYVEDIFKESCLLFGYNEIRLPVFEHTELYQRGVGDTTDIVQKEMYTFNDKAGRSITLRPEGTAGVVRSYIEHGMASMPQPIKLFYNITAYRYENVQRGRYREFNQFGVELFGASDASADIEIISLLNLFLERLGVGHIELNINSIGCPECRAEYNKKLKQYLEPYLNSLCSTCRERYERNPMRIIDCKEEKCREITKDAPSLLDHICNDCSNHFEKVKRGLSTIGIDYNIDKSIVRGLDYYTKTVFEFVSKNIGSQGTVCGGGRYDGLIEECGGKSTPGVGCALGVERLLDEMQSQGIEIPKHEELELYIAAIGEKAENLAEKLVYSLRTNGISCQKDVMLRSVKAQLKYANKINAKYVIVIGDNEIETGKVQLKNMDNGENKEISLDSIIERFKRKKV